MATRLSSQLSNCRWTLIEKGLEGYEEILKFMSSFTSMGRNFSIFDELNLSANPLDQTWTIAKVSSNTKSRPKRTQYCRIAPKVNKSIRASITSIINRYVYVISWQKKKKN